jgi:DNA modification methylase
MTSSDSWGGGLFNMCFTDPPYGCDYVALSKSYDKVNSKIKNVPVKTTQFEDIQNDELKGKALYEFLKRCLLLVQEHSVENWTCYMCFGSRSTFTLFELLEELDIRFAIPLVWDKGHMTISWNRYHPDYEMRAFFGPGSSPTGKKSVWYGPNNETCHWRVSTDNSADYLHPTQKPIELALRAIRNSTKKGDIVLDIFCGSGSTLIACEQTERRCYAMEIDPRYVDVTLQRFENLTKQRPEKIKK